MAATRTLNADEIQSAFARLAEAIAHKHAGRGRTVLLGIANGGIVLARRLATRLRGLPVGVLDISFHRDDIGRHPIPKEFAPTQIPIDVTGATVILVDDVLFSGRTVKAALDELFDHGRPTRVELAVLIDRGGRTLPIAADYVGLTLAAEDAEKIVVHLDPVTPDRDTVTVALAKTRR